MKWSKKFLSILMLSLLLLSLLSVTAFAAETGNVAGAVEDTWNAAKGQIKDVVNKVVFPVIDLLLAVLLFVKIATAYMDYRKHGQFEWAPPAILLATLIFSLTCPLYIWNILGM
jgi:hypothetical protein